MTKPLTMAKRIRSVLSSAVAAYGGPSDILEDAHTYGGGLLVAAGVAAYFGIGAGAIAFGVLLVFLGLRS